MVRNLNDMNTYTEPVEPLGFCEYESTKDIQVGDVVLMRSDLQHPGCCPFMTSVVEKIEPIEGHEHRLVHLVRPHMNVSAPFGVHGTAFVALERFPVEDMVLIKSFVRFTTGKEGKPDNVRRGG